MKWLGVKHEVVPAEPLTLEGIGKQHLLQAKPKAEPFVQYAHPEENLNDVHMNINGVDTGVIKELVNQRGEREPQPLANVDFQPVDGILSPFKMIYKNQGSGFTPFCLQNTTCSKEMICK